MPSIPVGSCSKCVRRRWLFSSSAVHAHVMRDTHSWRQEVWQRPWSVYTVGLPCDAWHALLFVFRAGFDGRFGERGRGQGVFRRPCDRTSANTSLTLEAPSQRPQSLTLIYGTAILTHRRVTFTGRATPRHLYVLPRDRV